MATVKEDLHMWVCSIYVHAIHLFNYKMKYVLLIGEICSVRNFMVACANQRAEFDAQSVSIYDNALSSFSEQTFSIISTFYLLLQKY